MSKNVKSVYMYKWIVESYMAADPVEDAKETERLLKMVYDAYLVALNTKDYRKISHKCVYNAGKDNEIEKLLIIDELRYSDGLLFGSVGITNKTLDSMVRQRDEQTMEHTELALSSPDKRYEFYTFFAISVKAHRLLILRNSDMPRNLHILLAMACKNSLGAEPYSFKAELFSEKDLRKRIKELKKVKIETAFRLHDIDRSGKPALKTLAGMAENKGTPYRLLYKVNLKRGISEANIDDIIELSQDSDCKVFKIYEAESKDPSNDAIDLLKLLVQEKREIYIDSQQAKNPDIVYAQFIKILSI